LQWGVDRVLPLRTTLLRCFFTRESEDLSTATFRRGPLLEDSRRGVCWRVGLWVSPCAVSPLVVFSPAVCGGCAPLRSSDALVALLSCVHLLSLRSGVGTPDLGWQQPGRRGRAAAARTSTTPAETLTGTQASPHQILSFLSTYM